MKRSSFFLFFCFVLLSFSHGQNYSIKGRLNTRLSLSFNRTNEINMPFIEIASIPPHPFQARLNMRADCNYGILNWLELGGYIGYIRYKVPTLSTSMKPDSTFDVKIGFAPTFGINANVHLLPFFVKNRDCKWEWYVTAKYGGTYLIKHLETNRYGYLSDGRGGVHYIEQHFNGERYRHEFGLGMGGGVYFWKGFGVYAEVLAGQYSYFPEVYNVYYTVRVGVEYKFTPKSKKLKKQEYNFPLSSSLTKYNLCFFLN